MEANNPLVSIVIPVYNAENYIQQTLDSVLGQTYLNFEIIVVDDGSTDSSKEILETYQEKITLYPIENSGVSYARNFAVERAKGEWIAFIDADDVWFPDKLWTQLMGIGENKWSHTDSFYIGENQSGKTKRGDLSKQIGGKVFDSLIVENFITTSTVLMKKMLFNEHGGFDESMEALEDWKLWLKIAKNHPLAYEPKPLAQYRVYDGSTSRKARKMLPIHEALIHDLFQDIPESPKMKAIKKEALGKSHTICSYIAEDSSDYSFSLVTAIKAWRLQPLNLQRFKRVLACLVKRLWNTRQTQS